MKWDVKIAVYLFLAYTLYGIGYLISDGDYVVPLPMLFIFVPLVSIIFFFTNGFNKYTIFFLLLPIVVMSDKISQFNPGLSGFLVLLSILSWVVLGTIVAFDKTFRKQIKSAKLLFAFPIACWLTILFLLEYQILVNSVFLLIGITSFVIVRDDGGKYNLNVPIRRLIILSSFTACMYLITSLSVYLA